jgi:uncharacterized protein YciI
MSSYFVYRLIPPRETFDLDMSDEERTIMARHGEYWRAIMEAGKVVVYGPTRDRSGSWGLGVLEAESEDEVRAIVANDPAISSKLASVEVGTMLAAYVRQ